MLRRGFIVVTVLAAVAVATGVAIEASAATTTLTTGNDAYVVSGSPSANFGTSQQLRVRDQTTLAYIRFTVATPPTGQAVSSATLRVYATSASPCPVEMLRGASDSWSETRITWNNQPGVTGSPLASAAWSTTGYKSFDVTSAVHGGRVTFVLRHAAGCTASSDATFRSREASSNKPRLVVVTSPIAPACSDGADNDGDGLSDYPADLGCTGTTDGDETDPPAMPSGDVKTVAAAGDIVCDPTSSAYAGTNAAQCQFRATDDLLAGADAVLELGDLQYVDGTLDKFTTAYDPTWGQYASNSYPSVGNHEYNDPAGGAQGYYAYWASKGRPTSTGGPGYYSFDLGSWHLVALNSNCTRVACVEGTAQNDWLEADLAATAQPCVLAYWHHPLWNSGTDHGSDMPPGAKAFWDDLYAAHADLVLNGHEHNYQRYAKQDPAGVATADGIREFVAGTGGNSHYGLLSTKDPNYEFGDATDFGVLRLFLGDDGYSWEFVNSAGVIVDEGGPIACN